MGATSLKRILVTGGAGFIGSHAVALLCDQGYHVTVIDNLSFGFRRNVDPRAEFVQGSIGDEKIVSQLLGGVDAVIHLAASSIIQFSYQNPQEYFQNNFMCGIVLLESMRKRGVKKIIYSSTAAVYGEPKRIPIKESDPLHPITIYGASKLAFEYALQAYYSSFGIENVSLRYFNAYGERDDQQPATRAVPVWINAMLDNQPIPLYWNGKQKRDYVYAGDIAQAHIDVLALPGTHVFNIGSGTPIIMKHLVKILEAIHRNPVLIHNAGRREGDPNNLVADIRAIRRAVGWQPVTPLEIGLRRTYEYLKSQREI